MRIRFGCQGCGATVEQQVPQDGGPLRCHACGATREASSPLAFAAGGRISRCALCPGDDLYLQRDFPRRAGLAVMALGAVGFLALTGSGHPIAGFSVLGVISLLDLALFRALPIVTVCYRCGAEMRGAAPNPAHASFDHHLAEEAAKRAAVDRANRPAQAARSAGPLREAIHGS